MPWLGIALVPLGRVMRCIKDLTWMAGSVVLIFYALGRVTLIVLAFIALRALPADTYQTLDWNNYFPHIGA